MNHKKYTNYTRSLCTLFYIIHLIFIRKLTNVLYISQLIGCNIILQISLKFTQVIDCIPLPCVPLPFTPVFFFNSLVYPD